VAQLIEVAAEPSFRQIITVIGDSAKVGSVSVHTSVGFRSASVGFRSAGTPHAAQSKFVQWLDVDYIQRPIGHVSAAAAG
jgi:L-amino acid N-acyltransferase YncA